MSEKRKSSSSRRASGNRKVNRAQLKAMEVRSAASVQAAPVADRTPWEADVPARRSTTRTRRRTSQAGVTKPALLTRAQEYAYIRSDFRRLVVTAGSLLVVMLVLLVVVK
ncbi:hypothetical protein BH24CHL4_BH24CHL4_05680 [soil metagenome]